MNEKNDISPFLAILFRQKYIRRWGLMRSVSEENLSSHACETAMLAHMLALIGRRFFGKDYDCERCALLALYHDSPEVLTGDMPTPVKYFSPRLRESYAEIEDNARERLLGALPVELRDEFAALLGEPEGADRELLRLVKAADKLAAYIKCIEERKSGNLEFSSAEKSTLDALERMELPELSFFRERFLPAFEQPLDENI